MLIKVTVKFISTRKEMPPVGEGTKEYIRVYKPRYEFTSVELKGKSARADKYWEKLALDKFKERTPNWETYKVHTFTVEKEHKLTRAI